MSNDWVRCLPVSLANATTDTASSVDGLLAVEVYVI